MTLILALLALATNPVWSAEADGYRSLIWIDLLPDEDLRALLNPPAILHIGGEDGSVQQQSLRRDDNGDFLDPEDDPFQLALESTNVRPELDGQRVRISGFIVPVEYNEDERVTEFFLVPYFGACIHVPPPPPNQLLYVTYPEGVKLPSIFDGYTISGLLRTQITDNAMALSAYRMDAAIIELYVEPEEPPGADEPLEDDVQDVPPPAAAR